MEDVAVSIKVITEKRITGKEYCKVMRFFNVLNNVCIATVGLVPSPFNASFAVWTEICHWIWIVHALMR